MTMFSDALSEFVLHMGHVNKKWAYGHKTELGESYLAERCKCAWNGGPGVECG